ncbi:UPF0184 protein C9orf16 homolog [Eumeta japonica]|uniref:UPF0184 protein C9orf16 homolog n=1 Tax=Eumeta variegata TaxID=151549 RepID=A0A4C1XK07_EUMVA|nr:UPF0184 protein C9orf16 homolog [Eumeta japonica]
MAGQENNGKNEDTLTPTNNEGEINEETDCTNISEEYELLDTKLDELNSALDFLEQKNDDIHAKLKELLQSNIEIREEMKNENAELNSK